MSETHSNQQSSLGDYKDGRSWGSLPDRDIKWNKDYHETRTGLTIAIPKTIHHKYGAERPDDVDRTHINSDGYGYIISGVDHYLDDYKTGEITPPATYSDIEYSKPYAVTYETTGLEGYGYGLLGANIETAIRLANDGGRYSKHDYTFHLCGRHPTVLESPAGYFIVSPSHVPEPDEYTATATIQGHEIRGEEHPTVQDGLKYLLLHLERKHDLMITGYCGRTRNNHIFETENGEQVQIHSRNLTWFDEIYSQDLTHFNEIEHRPARIFGKHRTNLPNHSVNGFWYSVDEDDLPLKPGDNYRASKYVLGYSLTPDVTETDGTPSEASVKARPYFLEVDKQRSDIHVSLERGSNNHCETVHTVYF